MRRVIVGGVVLGFVMMGLAPSTLAEDKPDAIVLTIATLAPKDSLWGKIFHSWSKVVAKETNDKLKLSFKFNGQEGDEPACKGKMEAGQIDGAAMTARGLASIHPPMLALQMPGLFEKWEDLDAGRAKVKAKFEEDVKNKGFRLVGYGDVGISRIMSIGEPIRSPKSMAGKKTFYTTGDPIGKEFFATVGAQAAPLEVPVVLTQIGGSVNVVLAPALAAEQLQWASKLEFLTKMPGAFGVGGLVFYGGKADDDARGVKAKLPTLPADLKAVLERTGKNTGDILTSEVRAADNAAYKRLQDTMKTYEPNNDELNEWAAVAKTTRQKLCGPVFDNELCTKLGHR